MSALLMLAAMAGTSFDCQVITRHFTFSAPSADVIAAHDGDAAALYSLVDHNEGFGGMKISEVHNALPDILAVELDDGEGAPIRISIFEIDQAKGAAKASISENITPDSAQATMIELEGNCSFMPQAGKGDA